jgi:hypothetical protein
MKLEAWWDKVSKKGYQSLLRQQKFYCVGTTGPLSRHCDDMRGLGGHAK